MQDRIELYKRLKEENISEINKLSRKIHINGTIRLIIFIILSIGIYYFWGNRWIIVSFVLFFIISFVFLLIRNNRLTDSKESADILKGVAEDELKAFDYDFTPFDGGVEYINPGHPFSFDLDIFGNNSIFQMINRTGLRIGKRKLADLFTNPFDEKTEILNRQQSIKELAQKEDFLLKFIVISKKIALKSKDAENFSFEIPYSNKLSGQKIWKLLTILIPFVWIIAIGLNAFDFLSSKMLIQFYILSAMLSFLPIKRVKKLHRVYDHASTSLGLCTKLFELIENERFESVEIQDIMKKCKINPKTSAAIHQLSKHTHNLEVAFSAAITILNPFLQWTTLYALRIEKWAELYSDKKNQWFEALGAFDALISQTTFVKNRPQYVFPSVSDQPFHFEGKNLGHPSIPVDKCVKNDIEIIKQPYFIIITGANMAGKSTYLRTIGVNHVLASMGMTVFADELMFFPGRLLTNLRTSDSLINNESYFFSELKRLKMIIDNLKSGAKGVFIILDEILKGTNSEDKRRGSHQLIKRLVTLKGNGIIATHDLDLGNLEQEMPESIMNYHFDADIKDDNLTFAYKMKRGIAQNMNAVFLLKKMGIVKGQL